MTREQIEETIDVVRGLGVETFPWSERIEQLIAAAERALLLEDVLAVAKDMVRDMEDRAWVLDSTLARVRAAIDRVEGR
jgi:hypothetical protein